MAMITIFNTAHPNGINLPDPSSLTWSENDISASDAGRSKSDLKMYKGRLGKKIKYSIAWNMVTAAEAATILQAVDDEYFQATIWDARAGQNVKREYYRSDPSAPVQIWFDQASRKIYQKISFNIIER